MACPLCLCCSDRFVSFPDFPPQVSTVLVVFPDGTQVVVPFKEDTLLIHLLPKIHKLKRLRLYTNEYVFAVSAADQKHLKVSVLISSVLLCAVIVRRFDSGHCLFLLLFTLLSCFLSQLMTPYLDMQQPVGTVGATTLEIQNKCVLILFLLCLELC